MMMSDFFVVFCIIHLLANCHLEWSCCVSSLMQVWKEFATTSMALMWVALLLGFEVLSTRLGVIWQCVKICFWGLGRRRNAGSTRDNQDLGLVLACLLSMGFVLYCMYTNAYVYSCKCFCWRWIQVSWIGFDHIKLHMHGSLGVLEGRNEGRRNEYLFCEHCVLGIILLPVGFYWIPFFFWCWCFVLGFKEQEGTMFDQA